MIVIDFSQVVISNIMVELAGRKDVKLNLPLVKHLIINSIRSYNKKHRGEFGEIIIACDNRNYWRRMVFPNYKAARKAARDASDIDWEVIFEAMREVKEDLHKYFPYKVVEANGAEADDIIATIADWSQEHYLDEHALFDPEPKPILIISGDRDFLQLQKYSNIKQYSPLQKKFLKVDRPVEKILLEHILRGDTGDGVPNILSADDVFVTGTRQKPLATKKVEAWLADPSTMPTDDIFVKNYKRNEMLVDLSKIPNAVKDDILFEFDKPAGVADRSKLIDYFIQHKMKNLLDVVADF